MKRCISFHVEPYMVHERMNVLSNGTSSNLKIDGRRRKSQITAPLKGISWVKWVSSQIFVQSVQTADSAFLSLKYGKLFCSSFTLDLPIQRHLLSSIALSLLIKISPVSIRLDSQLNRQSAICWLVFHNFWRDAA